MNKAWEVVFLFFLMSAGWSRAEAACIELAENFRQSTIQMGTLNDRGDCFFQITPHNYVNLTYRSYLISSSGSLMIFLSLGPGDPSTETGARDFFWPTHQRSPLKYAVNDRFIDVSLGAELGYRFDGDTGQLVSMRGARVRVQPRFSEKNKGGVEILSSSYLFLDGGFKLGTSPVSDLESQSKFTDRFGKTCLVQNGEVFQRVDGGDVQFKLSGQPFLNWLNRRCPALSK